MGLSAIRRACTTNDAVFRQFVGGMDPDALVALALRCSGHRAQAREVQTTSHTKQKAAHEGLLFILGRVTEIDA